MVEVEVEVVVLEVSSLTALGHLGLGVGEERAHVLLRLADVPEVVDASSE